MKKFILTLVVATLALSSVTEVEAKSGVGKGILKRKKKGKQDSSADGLGGSTTNNTTNTTNTTTNSVSEAPPAPAVKGSGLVLTEGESRDDYRARQRAAKGESTTTVVEQKSSGSTYTPQFKLGCGQYGIGSGYEGATRHFACEGGARLNVANKDWKGYSIFIDGTAQKSPYDGYLVYKEELDYGDTHVYGDVSLGVKHGLDFWKSFGELSLGGETPDGSHWKPVLKARLLSQPKDGLVTELELLTVGEPRTEVKLAVLSNSLAENILVGGYAGTRMYNSQVRHDRLGPVVRYQADGWAIEGAVEYAFAFKWGGGLKITIPKPW